VSCHCYSACAVEASVTKTNSSYVHNIPGNEALSDSGSLLEELEVAAAGVASDEGFCE